MVLSCAAATSLSGNIDASHTIQCRPRSNGPRSGPVQSSSLPSEEIGKENPGAGLCGYERYGADLGSWSPSTTNKTPNHRYLEHYSLMAATLAARFPEKALELFAYQAMIVLAERNYDAGRWPWVNSLGGGPRPARTLIGPSLITTSTTRPFTGRAHLIPEVHILSA